jgi:isocitrate lyase
MSTSDAHNAHGATNDFDREVEETRSWMSSERFDGVTRLYTARQVVEQRGTIRNDYTVARVASAQFHARLRELFDHRQSITTFGPYSPGQAVAMKRVGIEGIYIGGWATSAKGSVQEDPGPDLASYPLSQVPNEAAVVVRALLTADRNQQYQRSRMSPEERAASRQYDYRPFIIADADTGHGGDPHVRNLIRRFVEAGVTGYHIEDQRPGTKKCGHQGGKVLVSCDEQIKRLNAARFQLDIMGVPGLIVARTDAEAATLLDGNGDERDHPFILGATNLRVPKYKTCYLSVLKRFHELGVSELNGHKLYLISELEYAEASEWLDSVRILSQIEENARGYLDGDRTLEVALGNVTSNLVEHWEAEAGLKTYAEAVAEHLEFRSNEGEELEASVEEWLAFAGESSLYAAKARAKELGVSVIWNSEFAKTPEGYYQVRGGIDYAIAKSLAAAPFADLLWMETKTADLDDARRFQEAIHARFPDKMLAYNLSPSFNWDTTGMSDDEMREFPKELGKMGFVFNFITYGGHQIDGLAAEEFSAALRQDGMLALARLQRKFRLVESPYKTPQSLVGGPRLDGALVASSGRTATTMAMGRGSTQHQHLVQTEVPTRLLEEWLAAWSAHYKLSPELKVTLRPHRAGSELLEMRIMGPEASEAANVIFTSFRDRNDQVILSVRDQNTFDESFRKKRLQSLVHLFLIHRYKAQRIHHVSPSEDNRYQTSKMAEQGLLTNVGEEVGQIIVADVNAERVAELLDPSTGALTRLITKQD